MVAAGDPGAHRPRPHRFHLEVLAARCPSSFSCSEKGSPAEALDLFAAKVGGALQRREIRGLEDELSLFEVVRDDRAGDARVEDKIKHRPPRRRLLLSASLASRRRKQGPPGGGAHKVDREEVLQRARPGEAEARGK